MDGGASNARAVEQDDFRAAFRSHPAGVAIVTADAGDGPVALTVSSVASVAVDPPTLVFSASTSASATATIQRVETVVVHLLAADELELAKLGARSGAARFGDDVSWDRLPTGEPYYPGPTWMRGRISDRIDVNGSTLVVVEVLEASIRGGEPKPLVYHDRRWHELSERSALPPTAAPFWVVYGRGE